jgi:hypothetical protein
MKDYIPVEGYDNLCRDRRTGAIINTDKEVFEQSRRIRKNNLGLSQINSDIEILKNEMLEIKSLLREFIKQHGT